MKRYSPLILSIILLITFAIQSKGQSVIEIRLTAGSKAADKAAVMFGQGNKLHSYTTGADGKISIPINEKGVYDLKARKGSFRTSWYRIFLDQEASLPVKLKIEIEMLPRLDGISKDDPTKPEQFFAIINGILARTDERADQVALAQFKALEDLAGQRMSQFEAKESHFRKAGIKAYNEGNIIDAKEAYTRASQVYPDGLRPYYTDQAYYQKALEDCNSILSEKKEENENYDLAIKTADDFFANGDLDNAEKVYKQALQFRPNASYPNDQIIKVREKRKSYEANRMLYDIMVGSAEKWERQERYEKAIADYEQALALIPSETQLNLKIETLRNKAKERDQEFNNLIIIADRLKNGRNYEEALATYRRAKALKPDEAYPAQQISEITKIFQGRSSEDAEYNVLIAKADKQFNAGEWQQAFASYDRALSAKPGDEYAKQRKEEAARLGKEQKRKDEDFRNYIAEGDADVDIGDAKSAIEYYKLALEIYPNNQTAIDKLSQAESLLETQNKRSARLSELIALTREAIEKKDDLSARKSINEANTLAPDDREVKKLILAVEELEASRKEREKAFAAATAKARQAELAGKLDIALGHYEDALEVMPQDDQTTNKITELKNKIAEAEKEKQVDQLLTKGDEALSNAQAEKALQLFEDALKLDNSNARIINSINKAKSEITRIAALRKETDQLIAEGQASFDAGEYALAVKSWEEAYSKIPEPSTKDLINKAKSEKEILENSQAALAKALDDADAAIAAKNPELTRNAIDRAKNIIQKASLSNAEVVIREEKLDNLIAEIARDEAYQKSLAEGDKAMEEQDVQKAIQAYVAAQRQKDGDEVRSRLSSAYALQDEMKDEEERFSRAFERGQEALEAENWESAITAFTSALAIKEDHKESRDGLERAKAEAKSAADNANAFRLAYSRADDAFEAGEMESAKRSISEAIAIFPENQEALALQNKIHRFIEERAAEEKAYAGYIREADSLKSADQLSLALKAYESALEIKPGATYPLTEAEGIRNTLADQERKEKEYARLINEAESHSANDELSKAIRSFEAAALIKPEEEYPKNEANRLGRIYEERRLKLKAEYDKVIADADAAWQKKVIDQAMSKYREAQQILPEEAYPEKMIEEINTYLREHLVIELNRAEKSISEKSEMKFNFEPLKPSQRKSTYILLSANNPGTEPLKIYLNYGKGKTKSGGIVFKAEPADGEYIIRVSSQYRWYDIENDWIGIYPEGGEFKVSVIQMATGD